MVFFHLILLEQSQYLSWGSKSEAWQEQEKEKILEPTLNLENKHWSIPSEIPIESEHPTHK